MSALCYGVGTFEEFFKRYSTTWSNWLGWVWGLGLGLAAMFVLLLFPTGHLPARGIYPPLLQDQGLAAALASQARKATFPVRIEGAGIGRYPQEAEALRHHQPLGKRRAARLRSHRRTGQGSTHRPSPMAPACRAWPIDCRP